MNYKAIVDEVLNIRFSEADRSRAQNWVNLRYGQVWGADDWHFKRVPPATLNVVAGNSTPTMPTDFNRIVQLFDDQGNEVIYRSLWEFENIYQQAVFATTRGRPQAYTVMNRQIILVPTPDQNYTFKVGYERTVAHYDSTGTAVVSGLLSADTDIPIWDAAHHYLLVVGAIATGMKLINDFNAQSVEAEFAQDLQVMRDDLLPPDRGASNLQYGRDSLGDEAWV